MKAQCNFYWTVWLTWAKCSRSSDLMYKGVNAQGATTRATSDKLSIVARVVAWKFVCTHRLRACMRQIGMASYILEYDIIFIRIWHQIYWDMASYHIYWNMESYLLECGIIFIGMWHHIYWNMASHKLEYAVIFIVICCHIYWNI